MYYSYKYKNDFRYSSSFLYITCNCSKDVLIAPKIIFRYDGFEYKLGNTRDSDYINFLSPYEDNYYCYMCKNKIADKNILTTVESVIGLCKNKLDKSVIYRSDLCFPRDIALSLLIEEVLILGGYKLLSFPDE